MTISLDKQLYSKAAILRVAYQFIDSVYIHISQSDASWIIEWTPKKEDCIIDARTFENEAVAQQLRLTLLEDTSDLRRIVLARAYASTVVDDETPGDSSSSTQQKYSSIPFSPDDVLKGWYDDNGDSSL